jgi:hypothetical protein
MSPSSCQASQRIAPTKGLGTGALAAAGGWVRLLLRSLSSVPAWLALDIMAHATTKPANVANRPGIVVSGFMARLDFRLF